MTIPAGITREDVRAALEDLDRGIEHSFSGSTKRDLATTTVSIRPRRSSGLPHGAYSGVR